MKFLVDHQLPPALADFVRGKGFDCEHVSQCGFQQATDVEICRHAQLQERVIISKDEDFFFLATTAAYAKLRLVWVRLGNCRTATLLAVFEKLWPSLVSSLEKGERIIELR